jgi:alcohol dehydrogenase
MDKVLITGTTSGLGASLLKVYNEQGYSVQSIDRKDCDFKKLDQVQQAVDSCIKVDRFIDITNNYKYVFLNAGILGELLPVKDISLYDYQEVFNVNVWANKLIIDELLKTKAVKNIICISSGAASKGYYGWSLYCATKAAIKQLMSCYAIENPEVNFLSLAPGLVKTKMQDEIQQYDEKDIPSVKKFKDAYDTMQTPDECAEKIYKNLDSILNQKQDFFDLRNL